MVPLVALHSGCRGVWCEFKLTQLSSMQNSSLAAIYSVEQKRLPDLGLWLSLWYRAFGDSRRGCRDHKYSLFCLLKQGNLWVTIANDWTSGIHKHGRTQLFCGLVQWTECASRRQEFWNIALTLVLVTEFILGKTASDWWSYWWVVPKRVNNATLMLPNPDGKITNNAKKTRVENDINTQFQRNRDGTYRTWWRVSWRAFSWRVWLSVVRWCRHWQALLRDYINATIGFESLSQAINTPTKSLMRMFSQKGNPQAKNLFAVISNLQTRRGIHLEVRAVK